MKSTVIVSAARTPIGSFLGSLGDFSAPELGARAISACLERAGCPADRVDEVFMGQVLTAGTGQAPARQAAIRAGIPATVPATTVNKVCGSGMEAIILGARLIALGEAETVIAGGMESMSQAPHLLKGARAGWKLGTQEVIDSMIHDGLWDPYSNQHMGRCAEACAEKYAFTRAEQDEFAITSFKRAQAAQLAGKFKTEIAPVEAKDKKRGPQLIDNDEGPAKTVFDKIPSLKPVFKSDGTITAANASTLNDGAATLLIMSDASAKKNNHKPLARITGWSVHAHDPLWFTTAPVGAIRKLLDQLDWSVDSVDLFEINEAFAVVAMAAQKELNIPAEKLNVWGGAIALGHPIGASGARLVTTLLHALADRNQRRGIASLCIGGGEALALAIELF